MKSNNKINKDNLPSSIPLFAVSGGLLLPQIEIPLNVFEERYLNMIDDCLAERRLIGMIQPKQGLTASLGKKKKLYQTGCLGRIKAFNETDDGRYLIVVSGVCRFELGEEIDTMRGYRRFKVDYENFDDFNYDIEESNIEINKEELISNIDRYLGGKDVDAILNGSENFASMDSRFLVDFLCCYLPFSVEEKQLFVEAKSLEERTKALLDVLGMAAVDKVFSTENNNKIIH